MKLLDQTLALSPTDLAYFLACRHRTALELAVAHGVRQRPKWDDPLLEALFKLGDEHEARYVETLERSAKTLVNLADVRARDEAVARTLDAMRSGADVIVQAALRSGRWYGRPDILLKVETRSPAFGLWSYEVADTKLARETRGGTILQLGLYCEMLGATQGLEPSRFYVVAPSDEDAEPHVTRAYRVHDYAAYFRLMKARLGEAVGEGYEALAAGNYPEPVEHCDICPWSPGCSARRRRDDHLSLVAGISRMQRRELEPHGILTVESLAALGEPFPFKPRRGSVETYERVRDQARVQVESRRQGRIVYELIPPLPPPTLLDLAESKGTEPVGLARLPEPSPGDVFLDLEGDALAGDGGHEYLFGLVTVAAGGAISYRSWPADDPAAERRAFEAVIDLIMARWRDDPGMHVYHYAPYEPAAFKRLMGRFATRTEELDQLLRGRRFIDLYGVVRQGIRAGVEKYSIKNLEPLYGFTREVDLRDANRALRTMEQGLELDRLDIITPGIRAVVEGYNRDDCVSTLRLRDWLEARRADLIARGHAVPRPPLVAGDASPELDDKAKKVEALRARLLALADAAAGAGFSRPSAESREPAPASPEFQLAFLLDWHRREDKADWWEYFRLRELPEDELFDERLALAGLAFVGEIEQVKKSFVHRYRFPAQEMEMRGGDKLKTQDGKAFAEVVSVDRQDLTIDLKVGPKKKDLRPSAVFKHDHVSAAVIEDALVALGERVADAGGVAQLEPSAERTLLLRQPPQLSGVPFRTPDASVTDYAVELVTRLDRTVLPIQGPPGTGKTFTGARMICQLVRAGRRVGVAANSHKVIRNLLDAVSREAAKQQLVVKLGHKCGKDEAAPSEGPPSDSSEATSDSPEPGRRRSAGPPPISIFADNDGPLAALDSGEVNVLGGTAWLWARPEFRASVDALFVDEAGQISLANALGIAGAGRSLVLLGDPQQLEQPVKGCHPDGAGLSALEHILGGEETMPRERGLFLPVTWRLSPPICRFTSEMFYANKLNPKPGLEHQVLRNAGPFDGSGLHLVEVEHDGNRNASDEEAETVARLLAGLFDNGAEWVDEHGTARRLTPDDVRVVAPFNAHVARIKEALTASDAGAGFRRRECSGGLAVASAKAVSRSAEIHVGTVDKFQGQEAPLVIYSMATSTPDDAPRGLSFLYSLNRLNVATSRALCAAIVVASPKLFEPDCRTPAQMRLANALCRFREMAKALTPGQLRRSNFDVRNLTPGRQVESQDSR